MLRRFGNKPWWLDLSRGKTAACAARMAVLRSSTVEQRALMEFRILGPFEVEDDGRTIPLAGAKQRALLALLVLSRGRPVSTDRLIEDVWNGSPPETALKSIQVYVSQLRKALGEARLVTHERGYELVLSPGELDADRFDALVQAAAEAAPTRAAALLQEALAL